MQSSFNLYRFARDPDIVYTEGYGCGHPTANPDTVTDCSLRYDHLQAAGPVLTLVPGAFAAFLSWASTSAE